ncbi:MAG: hypothetical protein QME78_14715, partial [Thermodesulfobacteriota bacterium]|nr:hypothetical protein [Thermodesulfobacteriota bacterium]
VRGELVEPQKNTFARGSNKIGSESSFSFDKIYGERSWNQSPIFHNGQLRFGKQRGCQNKMGNGQEQEAEVKG